MSADLRLKLLFAVTLLMAAALATGVVPVAAQTPDASTTSATSPTTPTTPSTTTTAPETPTTPTTPTIPTTPATPTTPIAPTTPRQAPPTRTTEQSPGRKATGRPRARKAPKAKVKREGRGRAKRRRAREKPPERCLRLGEWKRWRHELLAEGRRREAEKLELCKRDRRKRDHGKARKEDRLAPVAPSRNTDGSPTPANPGFMDALPGPSSADGVPNFVIRKFRVPIFLLPIYQAAGIEYGIRWELLAAINEIETDYGRNLGVSSAGAVGWMQFLPSSWALYGVDGNEDGRRDPYNPVDAIFSAARYLKAAGYEDDVRGAIFAYNHADWYVDSVLLRARLIAGMPSELVGSLTGLTEGRFPVTEHATYADDIEERDVVKRVGPGENAANVIESSPNRRSIRIFSRPGAPVVAVNDGVIKRVDETPELGRFIVLEDVYGNRYTYAHLGEVASLYPVPSEETGHTARTARAIAANPPADPRPAGAASAGRQPEPAARRRPARRPSARGAHASAPVKQRLFAHPDHPLARASGGAEQLLEQSRRRGPGVEVYGAHFARPFGVDAGQVRLRPLRKGARVIGGTVLGRVGATVPGAASHVEFSIRPEGRGAPAIDPKPILDGWKLLEDTAIYRSSGRNVLHGDDGDGMSIGQVLLLPKPLLERRVLADERIEIYACGRRDIRSGQIDRRVLATLAFLAESGLRPRVTSLRCGHSYLTKSGNVSHHSSGNAADIAAVNGVPIVGHQDPGGIAEETVRQLLRLQGTLEPAQVISLLELGGPTLAMSDHADHIHVGFRPTGAARSFGVLRPRQWSDLVGRLREIENPTVPTKASRWSLPARPGAARNGGD